MAKTTINSMRVKPDAFHHDALRIGHPMTEEICVTRVLPIRREETYTGPLSVNGGKNLNGFVGKPAFFLYACSQNL
jgi:hypothetical protein